MKKMCSNYKYEYVLIPYARNINVSCNKHIKNIIFGEIFEILGDIMGKTSIINSTLIYDSNKAII